jgi:hypothetical protein
MAGVGLDEVGVRVAWGMRRRRLGGLLRRRHGLLDGDEFGWLSIENSVASRLPHAFHLNGRP